jgi:hypothetical protein
MATLVQPSQFIVTYPEFAHVDPLIIQAALDDADDEINEAVWGTRAAKGESALAAHLLMLRGALNPPGQSGVVGVGPVQAMHVGDVSLTYDTNALGQAVARGRISIALAMTKYGLEYTRLLDTLASGGAVTGSGSGCW